MVTPQVPNKNSSYQRTWVHLTRLWVNTWEIGSQVCFPLSHATRITVWDVLLMSWLHNHVYTINVTERLFRIKHVILHFGRFFFYRNSSLTPTFMMINGVFHYRWQLNVRFFVLGSYQEDVVGSISAREHTRFPFHAFPFLIMRLKLKLEHLNEPVYMVYEFY